MAVTLECDLELIPGYRLIERIGAGGFGEVWKAEAPGGILKAVKVIQGSFADSKRDGTHLEQELKALQRVKTIRHPYILSLERFDVRGGRLIIVSELADRTLYDRFKECREKGQAGIPRDELLSYMRETAEALDLMNEHFNLQHLDIKPQNIFLVFNHVKVGDFGLVKDLQGKFAAITSGVTAVYAAPETFDGLVTRFCDQYNLAVAYQEMLTGQLPFDGTTGRQLMLQHLTAPPNLRALPVADQPVVARALAKRPEARFPSCVAFVRALDSAHDGNGFLVNEAPAKSAFSETISEASAPYPTPMPLEEQTTAITHRGNRPVVKAPMLPGDHPVFATARRTPAAAKRLSKPVTLVDFAVPPPPERSVTTGDGILLPALVLGLGGLGTDVLHALRTALRNRGPAETWPHLRLLSIDTDSARLDRATQEPDSVLAPEEILVTPYQRLSHYVKRQHERDELQRWLPLHQLTNVARGQTTAEGWRALGRLAFLSAGPTLPARLRRELEACSDEKALTETARRTALGLRTTCPRVYVVTSLTGGTGSGMFLDMAAMLRRELRQIGYPRAELVAVLLAPAAIRNAEPRGAANSYAALRELAQLTQIENAAGKPAPFDRCVLVPLPTKTDGPAAVEELASMAGDFLCRELITPLGRVADEGRNGAKSSAAGMMCQTFGAYWFSVPRRPLLQRVAQHLCDRLVSAWKIDDTDELTTAVKTWVSDQLKRAELTSEAITKRLVDASGTAFAQPLQDAFDALFQRWAKGGPADVGQGAGAVRKAMAEIEQLLGSAQSEPDLDAPSPVLSALREGSRAVEGSASAQVADLILEALSEPQFRLACVEEFTQEQIGAALEEAQRWQRRRSEELRQQADRLWEQIPPQIKELHASGLFRGNAKARAADALRQLLSQFLRSRWDSAVALSASRLFQNLQGNVHRYRRGVECCHKRVGQFLNTFASADADHSPKDLGLGRYLLPFGCQTLEEAVARILSSLPPEEERTLQKSVWNLIHTTLKEHVHFCTAPASLLRDLRERIDRAVSELAENSLCRAHAAEVYLERQADYADADADLAGAFDQAQPEIGANQHDPGREFSILAVPPGPEGDRFRALVHHALPNVPMLPAASTDDIVFYREQSFASLYDVPQMNAAVREIYLHALNTAPFGPHSRVDIAW